MRARIEDLEKLSLLDPLTGVGNRRFCENRIDAHFNRMRRYGWPFGIIFADIDRFKEFNDANGHLAGDRVLTAAAQTMVNGIRASDEVFRWGGEEFIVVVQNVDADRLCATAEKLRRLIETTRIAVDNGSAGFTISVGGTLAAESDTMDSLIERADSLMYESKRKGRNRVSCRPGSP
jgi:diguanylate cyclase (GGDEF)-like protein